MSADEEMVEWSEVLRRVVTDGDTGVGMIVVVIEVTEGKERIK